MTEEKRGPGRPKKDSKLQFVVRRDFWPTDRQEDRVRKGTIVEMTAEEALDGIASGAIERLRG